MPQFAMQPSQQNQQQGSGGFGGQNQGGGNRRRPTMPEDTILTAEVEEIKVVTKPWKNDDGSDVNRVEFKFRVREPGTWDGMPIWGDTPTNYMDHPDCKLKGWAEAIENTQFPANHNLDTDLLVGKRVRIVSGHKTWIDKNTQEQRERHFVKDVMPARATAGAAEHF